MFVGLACKGREGRKERQGGKDIYIMGGVRGGGGETVSSLGFNKGREIDR